jgi:hypothetical protein
MLAVLGALGGVLLAWWGMNTLLAVNPDAIPRAREIRIDAAVGLATLGITVLSGLLFGLAPALRIGRSELQASLGRVPAAGARGAADSGSGARSWPPRSRSRWWS